MNKIVGMSIMLCVAYAINLKANMSTLDQRFGVNGYLTSLPFYYQDRDFYDVNKNQKKRKLKKEKTHRRNSKHADLS